MSNRHDVISAFLDDEPFNPNDLAQALSEPDGRALLIDLLALRHLMQPKDVVIEPRQRKSGLRLVLAAAAVLVAMVGGYFVGQREIDITSTDPPPATRVVEAPAAWQRLP